MISIGLNPEWVKNHTMEPPTSLLPGRFIGEIYGIRAYVSPLVPIDPGWVLIPSPDEYLRLRPYWPYLKPSTEEF